MDLRKTLQIAVPALLALIVLLDRHFDDDPERSLRKIAPVVTPWLLRHYEVRDQIPDYNLAYPKR